MKRVGYWLNEKKDKKLNLEEQKDIFRNAGIDLIKIDIDKPMEGQGPFDLIMHKITNLMVKAEGDPKAAKQVKNFQDYLTNHPECIVVDQLSKLKKLTDRNDQYNLLLQCHLLDSDSCVFTPAFVELTTTDTEINKRIIQESGVQFPFVCKPIVAHGSSASHQMCIIFNEAGLKDVQPPCVAQTFINHNAILYKVFVIGDQQFVTERPSLKNFYDYDRDTIYFDSGDISKPHCANALTELDVDDKRRSPITPDIDQLKELGKVIGLELGIELFGIDVIIDGINKKYAVVDINAFPGYEGVDGFIQILCNHLMSLMCKNTSSENDKKTATKHNGHHLSDNGNSDRRKRLKMSSPETTVMGCKELVCISINEENKGSNTAVNITEDKKTEHVVPFRETLNGCIESGQ